MHIFLNVLQGAYAYVTLFLILVVSFLLLTLIWLIAKRAKEAIEPSVDVVALPTSIELEALKGELTTLSEENGRLKGSSQELVKSNDKIKYLESKLLEYEILQEEIGSLSSLKVENEHLKAVLMQNGIAFQPSQPHRTPETTKSPATVISVDTPAQAPPQPKGGDDIEGLLSQIDELTQSVKKSV